MLAAVLRMWVWVGVLGLCLGRPGKTPGGHRALQRRQVVGNNNNNNNKHWEDNFLSRKYCDPSGNNSSAGNIVQPCGVGQYREWRGPFKGLCVSCSCNGLSHHCDPHTGKCLDCQYNTAGDHCEYCAEGYYGDAAQRTCRLCPCPFSIPSNSFALGCMQVGDSDVECVCRPGYAGMRCERCSPGYYGNPMLPYGRCQPCNCPHGNTNTCHPLTGECNTKPDGDNCQECDVCVVELMKELEAMDPELSRLREELLRYNGSIAPLPQLKRLEDAILETRGLVRGFNSSVTTLRSKVKQLETDTTTIDEDLNTLDNKARNLSARSDVVVGNVTETRDRGQDLLLGVEDLLKHIQELLDDLKFTNYSSGVVPEEDAERMLREAERLLEEMRRRNCSGPRTAALHEMELAQNMLDYITNVTWLSSTNQELAEQIGESLMRNMIGLRDLQKALAHAEDTVHRAQQHNRHSMHTLAKLKIRGRELVEERDIVTSDLQMAAALLGNVSDMLSMLQDSKREYEHLAAQLDGAKNDLVRKLNSLSSLPQVVNTVLRAEEHAKKLFDAAMDFTMDLQRVLNGSSVQRALDVIRAYANITAAIEQAERAAREAKQAADTAMEDIMKKNLTTRAEQLSKDASSLLSQANDTHKNLTAAVAEVDHQLKRVHNASNKMAALWRDLRAQQQRLKDIDTHRARTVALLNATKSAVSKAEGKVNATVTRVQEIEEGLKEIKIPGGGGGSELDDLLRQTNETLQTLSETLPSLNETLEEVESLSTMAPPNDNMTDSMRRIRELIQQARQMANAIKVPMMFTGEGFVELRPPVDPGDLRAVTNFDLLLQRPALPKKPSRGDQAALKRRRRRRRRGRGKPAHTSGHIAALKDRWGHTPADTHTHTTGHTSTLEHTPGPSPRLTPARRGRRAHTLGHTPTRKHTKRQSPDEAKDAFVLYLGSKNATGDFIGLVLRDGVLHSMYRLGGDFQEMKISNVTRSDNAAARYDRLDFQRIYQDMEVKYTQGFSSKSPVDLSPITLRPDSSHGLFHLDLDPNDTVLYLGGHPLNFSPPLDMGNGLVPYHGCMEISTLNHRVIGLYNFRQAVNVNVEKPCHRQVIRDKGQELYFDGTGYAKVNIKNFRRRIQLSVKSLLKHFLLFFIGNERSYYTVTVENGHMVLKGMLDGKLHSNTFAKQLFPTSDDPIAIDLSFEQELKLRHTTGMITIKYKKDSFNSFYIGGIPDTYRWRSGIRDPAMKGFVTALKVDNEHKSFTERLGVIRDHRKELLDIRHVDLQAGSSLSEPLVPLEDLIGLGFKTTHPGGTLLRTTKEAQGVALALSGGHVEFRAGRQAVMSHGKYNDGKWHYVTAILKPGLQLTVDDSDTGTNQPASSTTVTSGNNLTLGGDAFLGCLGDVYLRRNGGRYAPADLSQFSARGDVIPGECRVEPPPQALTLKPKHKDNNKNKRGSAGGPEGCEAPAVLLQSFRLIGQNSQLSFHIPPEELNYRPHFSMVLKTLSSEGLILHMSVKQNGAHDHVALYVNKGILHMAVGKHTIHHKTRVDDNQWHKVDMSVEEYSFHLLVDELRQDDGELPAGTYLSSPVYLGADLSPSKSGAQQNKLPKTSVTGCIYNFKFQSELVGQPVAKVGVSHCYESEEEPGVFFPGEAAYLKSKNPVEVQSKFHLTFNIRPRQAQGILFHTSGKHSQHLSVYLQSDKIIARANDGKGDYSVSIAVPGNLCTSFHSVSVHKQKRSLRLELGTVSRLAQGPSSGSFLFSDPGFFYFGGVPAQLQDQETAGGMSYMGCLRQVMLNGQAVSLESLYTSHGPAGLHGCPAD